VVISDINYRLVKVKWVDSYGCTSAWGFIEDKDPIAHHCYSVGWLVAESDAAIVVVPHLSPENKAIDSDEHGCGDMTIPKCSIIEIVDL